MEEEQKSSAFNDACLMLATLVKYNNRDDMVSRMFQNINVLNAAQFLREHYAKECAKLGIILEPTTEANP